MTTAFIHWELFAGLMVDINTAMAAAATERRARGTGDKERKKNRTGTDMGIESFDPVKHVAKEKADTASMWLVITFAATMALLMRYIAMPNAQNNADMLWFIPMLAIFLLPSVHRAVLPERFVEFYTKGTWFKASFMHIFTWLALTFLLTNAPFADIVAPQVDDGWGMVSSTDDGYDYSKSRDGSVSLEEGYTGEHYLVLAFSDNNLAEDSEYTFTFYSIVGDTNTEIFKPVNTWADLNSNATMEASDAIRAHEDIDYPVAIKVPEELSVGTYSLVIEVVEEGDPWKNTRTVELTITVDEPVEEESVEEDSTK